MGIAMPGGSSDFAYPIHHQRQLGPASTQDVVDRTLTNGRHCRKCTGVQMARRFYGNPKSRRRAKLRPDYRASARHISSEKRSTLVTRPVCLRVA